MDRVKFYSVNDWAGGYQLQKAEKIINDFDKNKKYTMEEIFYRASLRKDYCLCSFCKDMKDDLEKEDGKTIKEILNKNTIKLKKDTNLQDKEIEQIKKLFLTLGQSDIESQQRLIDLTCENLKKLTSDSKKEILKKGSLYKKLITFIGICIGIILI